MLIDSTFATTRCEVDIGTYRSDMQMNISTIFIDISTHPRRLDATRTVKASRRFLHSAVDKVVVLWMYEVQRGSSGVVKPDPTLVVTDPICLMS